jgi:predicted NAD/FAD-dependent oxidoreductase
MSAGRHVVVVGGGLAGITAAIALREAGASVTLLEARPRLGGATCSFTRDGLVIDNGQHVFLRCCAAYRGLLARLGMTGAVSLQDRFDVTVLRPGGRARLRRTGLPGPLHMGQALAGYSFLSAAERLRVARAALAMMRLDPARPGLDRERLGDWLAARGQGERARRLLWDLFTVSALNVAGDDASMALAATVVRTALLGARDAADIGVPAVPLGDLHGQAGARLLQRLGADVRLSVKVTAVQAAAGGFLVRLADRNAAGARRMTDGASTPGTPLIHNGKILAGPIGTNGGRAGAPEIHADRGRADGLEIDADGGRAGSPGIHADGVVLAVPPDIAARLIPAAAVDAARGPGPGRWAELGASPIVNVHVVYDRRVTRLPFAAAVESPVQWVFDRTRPSGLPAGQYLAVSLSAADDLVDVPAARLRERFVPALEDLFPAARDARITDFFVTRERRATFRQAPGCAGARPGALTALPGLVLAGAWTDTGWPDTMEGAVRSGLNAARELRRGLAAVPPAGRHADLVAGATA